MPYMWDATIQKSFKSNLISTILPSHFNKNGGYLLSSSNTAKRCLHGTCHLLQQQDATTYSDYLRQILIHWTINKQIKRLLPSLPIYFSAGVRSSWIEFSAFCVGEAFCSRFLESWSGKKIKTSVQFRVCSQHFENGIM